MGVRNVLAAAVDLRQRDIPRGLADGGRGRGGGGPTAVICLVATVSPGTHVKQAAEELCELATRLNVGVECDFNGHALTAVPGDTVEDIHQQYEFWQQYDARQARRKQGDTAGA